MKDCTTKLMLDNIERMRAIHKNAEVGSEAMFSHCHGHSLSARKSSLQSAWKSSQQLLPTAQFGTRQLGRAPLQLERAANFTIESIQVAQKFLSSQLRVVRLESAATLGVLIEDMRLDICKAAGLDHKGQVPCIIMAHMADIPFRDPGVNDRRELTWNLTDSSLLWPSHILCSQVFSPTPTQVCWLAWQVGVDAGSAAGRQPVHLLPGDDSRHVHRTAACSDWGASSTVQGRPAPPAD